MLGRNLLCLELGRLDVDSVPPRPSYTVAPSVSSEATTVGYLLTRVKSGVSTPKAWNERVHERWRSTPSLQGGVRRGVLARVVPPNLSLSACGRVIM